MPSLSSSSIRASLRRRDFAALKAALTAEPAALSRLWPKLNALERAACWRLLPSSALSETIRSLPRGALWQAYLSSPLGCLAPLLANAPAGARRFFRAPAAREAALLRARLS